MRTGSGSAEISEADDERKQGEGRGAAQHHAVSFAQNDMAVEDAEQDDAGGGPLHAGFKARAGVLLQKSLVRVDTNQTLNLFDPVRINDFFNLIEAADYDAIRAQVLEEPSIINIRGSGKFEGMRPIHLAASEGLDRICALFLRQRVECKLARDRHGREPMHWAAIAGSISTIKTLYDGACFAKNTVDELGFTALHYAAISTAATDIIPFLVRIAGFDIAQGVTAQSREDHMTAGGYLYAIRAMCCTGDTALHVAVKAGSAVACKRLVSLKANVRAVNSVGRTPLHDAVAVQGLWSENESNGGPASTFKLLISAGAPVHAVDADGQSALHVAAAFNTVYALAYFMVHTNMDVSAQDLKGMTALLIAVKHGNLEAVKMLQGVNPSVLDDVDFEGNSALHIAVRLKDDQEMIQLLDLQCLNTELKNKAGKTAEELAVEAGKSGLAEKLREYAKIHEKMALDAIRAQTEMQDGELKIKEFYRKASDDKSPTNDAQELPPLKSGMFAHFAHDQRLQSFVEQFSTKTSPRSPEKLPRASPNSSALAESSVQTRGLDQAGSKWDPVTMIKDFVDRFASRFIFDRCTSWKRKGHGLDPPLAKATMGYEDMITLLETLGLMDQLVARPEIYKLFWTKAPGQSKASPKEITFSAFRSHMQHLATKAPPEMIQRFLSQPEEFQIEDDHGAGSRYSSSEEDEMDCSSSNASHLQRSHIDRTDYIPTISGVNGQSRGSSRGLTSSSTFMSRGTSRGLVSRDRQSRGSSRGLTSSSTSMSRETGRGSELRPERTGASSCESPARRTHTWSPDHLFDAFRDFSLSSPDKVRVDMDAGAVQQPSWASGGGMQFCKNKLHDLKELSCGKVDLHQSMDGKTLGRGLRSSSRLSTGVSTRSGTCLFQPPPNSLIWRPMGCSRSGKVIQLLEQRGENYSSISDLSHYLKPIWIEFSPPVAPMPQLIDGAHEATYAVCFEMGDYVGCFEVIQSSLNHTSRDQVDLFQRMYAQAVVFCNSYARRCIKARNLPAAAALLRKSEDMTGPSVADYPGRRALRGWTMDTHAQYYFQRKKMNAALHYMQRAIDYIARIKSAEGKATWRAHFAAILFRCNRAPEAVEFLKDALSGVVGAADGAISKEHILHGKIPHANRNLAAALCFNLSVCQAQMNQFEHALTSSRFALLLCHEQGENVHMKRMRGLHDSLVDILKAREAVPLLRTRKAVRQPPRSESTPPGI